jgi:folylpolyglutamate synthase/dihydropteroate synthase
LLFGMSGDKDTRSVLGALAPYVDKVVTTRGSHLRAADPAELARRVEGCSVPIEIGGPIEVALPAALAGGGLVIVAGSVFLAGAARELYGAS